MSPYLFLAAAVPMLAVLALVAIGSENRFTLLALSLAGVAGFGAVFLLSRQLQSDLESLERVMRAPDNILRHSPETTDLMRSPK